MDHAEATATVARLKDAIEEALAIFNAINAGGLLDTVPADERAAVHHDAGYRLLQIMEANLRAAHSPD